MIGTSRRCGAFLAAVAAQLLLAASPRLGTAQGTTVAPTADPVFDSETLAGLAARCIGPAAMSGRIAALDAVRDGKLTVYIGAAGGGVWKSVDGGVTCKPVFDRHCQSIGAIAIDPTRPQTVWVGTGESWVRNSVSVGDGIYKSIDGGESWSNVGLAESERIARIAIDPKQPDTVFVAVTGHLWNAHEQRGVYRTRDGGKTWTRVLYVDADTGCADLAMDPSNPQVLYAAMWQFRRRPDFFTSGGKGSGLFKSDDGGETWRRLSDGLPAGELGRIGVAVAPSKPQVVYAAVEARDKQSALYRSDDGGARWIKLSASANVTGRPFYFAYLVVDPQDPMRVYKPGTTLTVSTDGGGTFGSPFLGGGVHADLHALWIDPANPNEMLVGTDGGVYASHDRGNHWRMMGSLPVSQFYHVTYDMEWPYNVYGGLQDNGTWMGPSRRTSGSIGNRHWRGLGSGDGFWVQIDPQDPDIVYWEYQGGSLARVHRSTGESKEIRPLAKADEPEYRFNWNTPVVVSPTRDGTLYVGAQFLFRSRDRGESWERISPDLTTNDPAKQRQAESGGLTIDNSTAENHCTIFAIAESPRDRNVLWVGTDDGNLQLTRDGGRSWTNVGKAVPGLPKGTWVSSVEASPHDAAAALVTFDGHMTGDMRPYLFATTDHGRTWRALATDAVRGYGHVVRQDPVNPDLLFLGTEQGLFVSPDRGVTWAQYRAEFPSVAVRDLAIHPREHDLIVATHGRGVWILDDLTPLRALTRDVLAREFALLPTRPSVMAIPAFEQRYDGDADYDAPSPSGEAAIVYYLKKRHVFGDLKLEVRDGRDSLLAALAGGKRRGINRAGWPMRLRPPQVPPATSLVPQPFSFLGPRVPEGEYQVTLTKGEASARGAVRLLPDPRSQHTPDDRALQQQTAMTLYRALETLAWNVDAMVDIERQCVERLEGLPAKDSLRKQLEALRGRVEQLRGTLVATGEGGMIAGEKRLRERLGSLYGAVNGYDGRPTHSQLSYTRVLSDQVDEATRQWSQLGAKQVAPASQQATGRGLQPLRAMSREEWDRRRSGGK